MPPQPKLVSAVVTTRNESQVLASLLRSLQKQTYSKIEIIVVDNFSTDETLAIAKQFTNHTYQIGPERSAQRNYGASISQGDYLAFLDADMVLEPTVIAQCVTACEDKAVGGVAIPEKSVGNTYWEKIKSYERSFYESELNTWIESARFFPKKIFFKVSGYDEQITGPEDWDLSESVRKSGLKIVKISSYIIHQERISSLARVARKWYYYGLKSHRSLDKQHSGLINPKTVHFLRPEFYRQWKKLMSNPWLTLSLIVLLSVELVSGGVGFVMGKVLNK